MSMHVRTCVWTYVRVRVYMCVCSYACVIVLVCVCWVVCVLVCVCGVCAGVGMHHRSSLP